MTGIQLSRRSVLVGAAAVTGAFLTGSRPAHTLTTIRVSDLGFDATDSTSFLQEALDGTADVVIVDDVGSDWITGPLIVSRDNLTIVIEPGVTLQAKAGAFTGTTDSLLTIENRSGITVLGYGATMAMNKPEYTSGEWRHVINLRSSSGVTIEGLTLSDSGGDGLYVGVSNAAGSAMYCSDITVRNVIATRNRRNALSVTSVDGMVIEHCEFLSSAGASPQGGVDFEPNRAVSLMSGIEMRDCRLDHNGTYGLIVSLGRLDATSAPVDMLFERITVGSTSSQIPNFTYYGSGDSAPTGRIEVRDSLIRKSPVAGAVGVFAKAANGPELVFTRTVIWDPDNPARWQPVTIAAVRGTSTTVTGRYGGVAFDDCLLIASTTGDCVTVDDEPAGTVGLGDVTGTLAIANENGVTTDFGANPSGVTVSTPAMPAYPTTLVAMAASSSSVSGGDEVVVTFTRTSSDLQWPVGVVYTSATGTAVPGLHFDLVSRSIVFPAGSATVELRIQTRSGHTSPVTLRLAVGGGRGYNRLVGSDTVAVVINP